MNDAEALQAAVRAFPQDDLPRLAYADWLEENGQAHQAEFIRLQLRLAQSSAEDTLIDGLRQREQQLLSRYRRQWTGPVLALGLTYPRFERGFIMAGLMDVEVFLQEADHLFAIVPLWDLTLIGDLSHLARLENRHLQPLQALRLRLDVANYRAIPIASLINRGLLDHLRVLDVSGINLATGHYRRLLTRDSNQLRELGLAGCWLDAEALGRLFCRAEQLHTQNLQVLDLRDNHINQAALQTLIACPGLQQLRWLWLEGNPLQNRDLALLCDAQVFPHLTHLGCDVTCIDPELLQALQSRIHFVGSFL